MSSINDAKPAKTKKPYMYDDNSSIKAAVSLSVFTSELILYHQLTVYVIFEEEKIRS